MADEPQPIDTLRDEDDRKSSRVILDQLKIAEDAMREWNEWCQVIDDRFSMHGALSGYLGDDWTDQRYDLFWASMEVIKPAVYTKAPKPVASPRFSERTRLLSTTSQILERCLETSFDQSDIDGEMLEIRDDLVMAGRGVIWVRQEEQAVCYEQIDRTDFRHEPARKWRDVGWVARRAWMTREQIKDRFDGLSNDNLDSVFLQIRREDKNRDAADNSMVAGIWEVWHKADNRVYWVCEGCDFILEDGEPHLSLSRFFPCPKPAYGTLRRRSLVPVPDYFRYAPMLAQVNDLTRRIYDLLAWVKMIGLVPAGGDVSEAITAAFREHSSDTILIPVPGASFNASAGGGFVQWMPIADLANAITGLLGARDQIIQDFYQLSGISDIMRGATEASETLGAQQLKSQYGSVRVRDKINELQRLARDAARIGAEIIAENFTQKTIMEMAMMDLPTKAEVSKTIKDAEESAKADMEALGERVRETPPGAQQMDPEQAKQMLQAEQQKIIQQYAPILREADNAVTIEAVMDLLRREKSRGFQIEIETDSTVLTDEIAEKQGRAEFLGAFSTAAQSLMLLAGAGEGGAKLGGGILKFAMAPFRVGRELEGQIDAFMESAPEALAAMQGDGQDEGLAEAQRALADAEMAKAQAQTMKVQADAQAKMQDLQLRAAEAQAKAQDDVRKGALEVEKVRAQIVETEARVQKVLAEIEKIRADTPLGAAKVTLDAQRLQLDASKAASDAMMRDRQQRHTEATTARNMDFTERNADEEREFKAQQAQPTQGD